MKVLLYPVLFIVNKLKVKSKMFYTLKHDNLEFVHKSTYELECLV